MTISSCEVPHASKNSTDEAHVEHILTKLAFTARSQIAARMAERTAERRPSTATCSRCRGRHDLAELSYGTAS